MATPDPDARMVMDVLMASDQPMTTELLLSAAKAYEALVSSRERIAAAGVDELAVVAAELERERNGDLRGLTAERFGGRRGGVS